jgi:C-terminal processing protease CtpA/Prc
VAAGSPEVSPLERSAESGATDYEEPSYLLLAKSPSDDRAVYERPVVMIADGTSFGAVTLLADALRQLPNVTLLGTETGGGHGLVTSVRLPHSDLLVQFASARVELADGVVPGRNGLAPRLPVSVPPETFLRAPADPLLAAARKYLGLRR